MIHEQRQRQQPHVTVVAIEYRDEGHTQSDGFGGAADSDGNGVWAVDAKGLGDKGDEADEEAEEGEGEEGDELSEDHDNDRTRVRGHLGMYGLPHKRVERIERRQDGVKR